MRPAACTQQLVSYSASVTGRHAAPRYRLPASTSFLGKSRVFGNKHLPRNAIFDVKPITAGQRRDAQAPRRQQSVPVNRTLTTKAGFGDVCKTVLKALLLVPVLFLPVVLLPKAAISDSTLRIPIGQTIDVWPVNHTPHEGTISSISDSTTEPSPVSTTGVSDRISSLHGIAASPVQHHVVGELEQMAADYSLIQLAVGAAFGLMLVVALRNSQLKHAGSQFREAGNGRRAGPKQLDSSLAQPSSPERPSSPVHSVQDRKQKASRDIAAAKARQAAYASQGQSQFTDADIARPASPRPSALSGASATDTTSFAPPAKDDTTVPTDETPEDFAGWDSTDAWITGGPALPGASAPKQAAGLDSTDAWTDAASALPTDSGNSAGWDSTDAWTAAASASSTDSGKPTGWDSTDAWTAAASASPTVAAAEDSTGWDSTDAWTAVASASPPDAAPEKSAGWDSTDSWTAGTPALPTASAPAGSAGWDSTDAWTAPRGSSAASGPTASSPAEAAEDKALAWDSTDAWIGLKGSGLTPIRTGKEDGVARARQSPLGDLQKKGQQPGSGQDSATIFLDDAEEGGTDSSGGTDSLKGSSRQAPSGNAPAGKHDARAKAQTDLKNKSEQTQSVPPVPATQSRGQTFAKSPRLDTPAYDPTSPPEQPEQPRQQAEDLSSQDRQRQDEPPPTSPQRRGQTFARSPRLATPAYDLTSPVEEPEQPRQQAVELSSQGGQGQDEPPPTSPQRRGQTFARSPRLATPAYDPSAAAEEPELAKQRRQLPGDGVSPRQQHAQPEPPSTSPQRRGQTFARSPRLATPAYDPHSPAVQQQQQPKQQAVDLSSERQRQAQNVTPVTSQQQRGQTFAVSPRLATAAFQPPYDSPQQQQHAKQEPGAPPSGASAVQAPPSESDASLQYQQSLGNWSSWFSALQKAVTGGSTAAQTDEAGPSALLDRQAQVSGRKVRAAQRMAKAQEAQQAKPRVARELTTRQYEAVDLPGSVDEFVRARGVRGPLLLLAGLAASAAQTLEPVWPVSEQGARQDAFVDVEPLDWEQYRKYDVFHQLLKAAAASPTAQEQGYSPLQALADAVPQAGVPKYDFLRNILKTAAQHRDSQAADDSKYNPLQALSRAFANFEEPTGSAVPDLDPWGNLMQQVRDPSTYARSKYDPFHQLFNAQGPAAEAPELDPLGPLLAALRQPWSRPPSSKYDVFQAIFSLQGPSLQAAPLDPLGAALRDGKQPWQSVNSKYDPVQAFFTFAAQSPTGDAPLDPLPGFFRAVTQSSPQVAIAPQGGSPAQGPLSQRLEKYIPLRQLFSSMAGDAPTGPTPGFDPVGSLLKSAWLKETRRLGVPRQLPAPENADYPASDFEQAYSRRRQAGKDPQQEMASLMQQRATRPQPPAEVRKTAGGQQGEEEEEEEEGQWAEEALGMGRGRPSEWAGFIYNPYSGDLLPQEGEAAVAASDTPLPEGGSGRGFGAGRKGSSPGQGKPQFVSANAFRRPASTRPAVKAQAQGSRAADLALASTEQASSTPPKSHPIDAVAMLSHMSCI